MKLHKPILNAIHQALQKIINENFYSDKVLEYLFKTNKKLGKKDRQIIAETTYNIVRNYRYYHHLAQSDDLLTIIDVYFQQHALFNDSIVHDSYPSPNVTDRNDLPLFIQLSYNDELWQEGVKQLGNKWLVEAKALNTSAPLVIRTNTLKTNRDELKQLLENMGIQCTTSSEVEEALIITNKKYLSQNEWFKKGYYEIQDLSSQKVGHFIPKDILVNAKRVIDACAGAGGKTLHLSALMQNKGRILALDINEKKLAELRKRARRDGCSNIQTKRITSTKLIKQLANSADIVLIDSPCSGTGVIKRNPDVKIKFTTSHLQELINLQQDILNNYSIMVKPEQYLLYVTCSILPEENEKQIERFLAHHPNFGLIKQQTLYPSDGFDGFYMALLKRME